MAASFVIPDLFRPSPDNLVSLAGSGLAVLVLSVRIKPTRFSDWCARISLWVSLAHVLVIQRPVTMGFQDLSLVAVTLVGSLVPAVGLDTVVMRMKGTPARVKAAE